MKSLHTWAMVAAQSLAVVGMCHAQARSGRTSVAAPRTPVAGVGRLAAVPGAATAPAAPARNGVLAPQAVMPPAGGSPTIKIDVNSLTSEKVTIALPQVNDLSAGPAFAAGLNRDIAAAFKMSTHFDILTQGVAEAEMKDRAKGNLAIDFANWQGVSPYVLKTRASAAENGQVKVEYWFCKTFKQKYYSGSIRVKSDYPELAALTIIDFVHTKCELEPSNLKPFGRSKIAFMQGDRRRKELFVMDPLGRHLTQLTNLGTTGSPAWRPNGDVIAFTSYFANNPDLYIISAQGGKVHTLCSFPGLNVTPAWSPDGNWLAVTMSVQNNPELYKMPATGGAGKIIRLTSSAGVDISPSWDPTSQKLCFVSDREGGPGIYVVDINDSSRVTCLRRGGYNVDPAWSPDGSKIAFIQGRPGRLAIMNATNGSIIGNFVPRGVDGDCAKPSWDPRGELIVCESNSRGSSSLVFCDLEGNLVHKVTFPSGIAVSPVWSPLLEK